MPFRILAEDGLSSSQADWGAAARRPGYNEAHFDGIVSDLNFPVSRASQARRIVYVTCCRKLQKPELYCKGAHPVR